MSMIWRHRMSGARLCTTAGIWFRASPVMMPVLRQRGCGKSAHAAPCPEQCADSREADASKRLDQRGNFRCLVTLQPAAKHDPHRAAEPIAEVDLGGGEIE